MYKVMNISLGSSKRNFAHHLEILSSTFCISRIGTDGSLETAKSLIQKYDGQVDVFTLGGVNLNYCLGQHKYLLKEGQQLLSAASKTPVVDGEYTKAVVDIETLKYLLNKGILTCKHKNVLFMSVLDRYFLAQAFADAEAKLIIGDVLFALKLPFPFRSLKGFTRIGRLTLPLLRQIPLKFLYPLGKKQEKNCPRFARYFHEADIIAGDYHFIHRNMPENLEGKTIITSTVTPSNIRELKSRGVSMLVTTSPSFEGRSYGSNVLEGIMYCLLHSEGKKLTIQSVKAMATKIGWEPRVEYWDGSEVNRSDR